MRLKLTEEEKLDNREARKAATIAKHMAEQEAAKRLKEIGPLPFRGKSIASIAAYNSAVAAAMDKPPAIKFKKAAAKAAGVSAPVSRGLWVTWVYGDSSRGIMSASERYPAKYEEYKKSLTTLQGAAVNFASEAAATFGKADYEALAEEYAESEENSPAAAAVAASALPALPALPASAPALPVAALIEHIDTIHAEIGAIRSLLVGLRGGSQRQKQKRKQIQKTRRLRK